MPSGNRTERRPLTPPADARISGARIADIAIVGAGPAGCAAALSLRRIAPAFDIVLIEAEAAPERRIGEVLPAAALAMLDRLGAAEAVAPACLPAPGLVMDWGGQGPIERHALFSARGPDHHLDRSLFERLLAGHAGASGVTLRRGAAVTGAARAGEAGWRLCLGDGTELRARFAIWATGRRRFFLRAVGARQRMEDRLVGYLRYFAEAPGGDPRTMLEAAPEGWWYAAALPGGGRGVAFMTDGDLGNRLDMRSGGAWRTLLARTRLIRHGFGDGPAEIRAEARAAASSLIEPVCGPDWIAAGDAASTFEPLSSQGIAKALRSGCFAAYAAFDFLEKGEERALARYSDLVGREFAQYRAALARHYAAESRWPEFPFWKRRRVEPPPGA